MTNKQTTDSESWTDPLSGPFLRKSAPKFKRNVMGKYADTLGTFIAACIGLFLLVGFIAGISIFFGEQISLGMLGIITAVFAGLVFFAPCIIASKRNHRNYAAIAILNILAVGALGFPPLALGWLAALIWSLYVDKE